MKIKTKLIISFCIILFVPSVLACMTIVLFQKIQMAEFARLHGMTGIEGDAIQGSLRVLNQLPPEELREICGHFILVILLILIVTAVLLIGWMYQTMITPIKKLQIAADNIRDGNLDFSVDYQENDEIGQLAKSFEEMRQRLKDSAEEKISNEKENRALISNIAHDLKTPITAVKGYAEGIMDGVANTPEKVDKYIRTIYNKANEMDTLINELTFYTKIDTNRIPYNFAKINVSEYFTDCVEEIGMDL